MSGSKGPAEQGTLIFLAAGDKSLYDEVTPMLDVMGKLNVYLGEVGAGARMKLAVNCVMGSMMNAFGEGALRAARGLRLGGTSVFLHEKCRGKARGFSGKQRVGGGASAWPAPERAPCSSRPPRCAG